MTIDTEVIRAESGDVQIGPATSVRDACGEIDRLRRERDQANATRDLAQAASTCDVLLRREAEQAVELLEAALIATREVAVDIIAAVPCACDAKWGSICSFHERFGADPLGHTKNLANKLIVACRADKKKLADLEAQLAELYEVINIDRSLNEHQGYVDICSDAMDALEKLPGVVGELEAIRADTALLDKLERLRGGNQLIIALSKSEDDGYSVILSDDIRAAIAGIEEKLDAAQ